MECARRESNSRSFRLGRAHDLAALTPECHLIDVSFQSQTTWANSGGISTHTRQIGRMI